MALNKNVYDATKLVLIKYPDTRNDDNALISKVIEITNPSIKGCKFKFVLENYKDLGLPSFKSIERYRRKLQGEYPELKANDDVKDARAEYEAEYKDFARS